MKCRWPRISDADTCLGVLVVAYRLNGPTVHDDGVSDVMQGDSGLDGYFAHLPREKKLRDKIDGLWNGEVVTQI